jgi:CRP-like cAMP-binding protein
MTEALHNYINSIIQLSDQESRELNDIITEKTIKKREHIAETGKVCSKVIFINRGYFRFYHLNHNGDEITSDFYFAPCFITSYTSFITGKPSMVNVQAMTDVNVIEFNRTDIYKLYNKYQNIERLGRRIAESVAITSEEHLFLLLNQTAKTRYITLLEKYPEYVKTIPLQYIASYLGITKETLSRMRKNLIDT